MTPKLLAPSIVVVNVDSHLTHDEIVAYAAAQQRQCLEHWGPLWGSIATVRAATADDPPRDGEWQLKLVNQLSVDNALGDHEITDLPIMFVSPALDDQYGVPWTTTASHEVLETLADPLLRRCVQAPDGHIYALEVCDAVEADAYEIDGVKLSNFCTPAYYEPTRSNGPGDYDQIGLVIAPYEVRQGGYAQYYDAAQGWVQVGAMRPHRAAYAELRPSRYERRCR